MRGRHATSKSERRTSAKQLCVTVAPVAAVVIALGATGAGIASHNQALLAGGAGAGILGAGLQNLSGNASRSRLRDERFRLRRDILSLEMTVGALRRELAMAAMQRTITLNAEKSRAALRLATRVTAAPEPARPHVPSGTPGRTVPLLSAPETAPETSTTSTSEPPRMGPVHLTAGDRQSLTTNGAPLPPIADAARVPMLMPAQRPPATPMTGIDVRSLSSLSELLPPSGPACVNPHDIAFDTLSKLNIAPGPQRSLRLTSGVRIPTYMRGDRHQDTSFHQPSTTRPADAGHVSMFEPAADPASYQAPNYGDAVRAASYAMRSPVPPSPYFTPSEERTLSEPIAA